MLISYEKSIENWEQFTKYGTITADTRTEIAESWIRCREAGVDPLHGRGEQVSSAELSVRLNDRKQLIAVARPVMNSIFQIIKSTVYGIVLTDQDGVILETVHHEAIEPECAKVNFFKEPAGMSEAWAPTRSERRWRRAARSRCSGRALLHFPSSVDLFGRTDPRQQGKYHRLSRFVGKSGGRSHSYVRDRGLRRDQHPGAAQCDGDERTDGYRV